MAEAAINLTAGQKADRKLDMIFCGRRRFRY